MANEHNTREKKIVLASGVFDLLHLGHVRFLEAAKKAGGENAKLVVVIARDSTVMASKGRKPVMPDAQRRALVESLKVVDEAVLGFEVPFDIGEVIAKIKPDVIALGYDQENIAKQVQEYVTKHKLSLQVVRIGKFEENALDSSSKIRQRVLEDFAR